VELHYDFIVEKWELSLNSRSLYLYDEEEARTIAIDDILTLEKTIEEVK
jgi:hypothetical protein